MRLSMAKPDVMRSFMQSYKKLYSQKISSEMHRITCGKSCYTLLTR